MKFAFILSMLCVGAVHAAPSEGEPAAVMASPAVPAAIGGAAAEFRVPVQAQSVWAWNLGAPGALEFAWLVEVVTPEGPVRFGVQVWHEAGATPTKGSLSELVASGQAGVWPAGGTDGPPMAGLVVNAEVQGDSVVLQITDSDSLAWLAGLRPGMVKLLTQRGHGPRPEQRFKREWSRMVPVVYRD